ncbi:MAG: Gfo/Idh/MocA family protein [Promethearchaeota archaeon]
MSKKTAMIVGFGGHARASWYKSLKKHPDWELVGIVDTDMELLSRIPEMDMGLDEDQVFSKIEEVKAFADLPDLMIIATPIYTHHVLVKDAMDAGVNVICEKNLASTIYQGRQMLQLAIDHPELATAVGTQRRYSTTMWTLKQYLKNPNKSIGELNFIQWNDAFNWGLYRQGWRRWLQELYAEDQMIHWFDLLRYTTSMDIVQVYADSFIPKGINWQGSSTVIANLALAKPEDYYDRHKWVWVRFYGDWQRRGPRDAHTEVREFSGTKGRLIVNGPWLETWIYTNEEGTKWEEDGVMPDGNILGLGGKYEGQEMILEQMKIAIDSNGEKQPDNNFKDVFKSFAAVMGAIESSRTGRAIFVPDYWKHFNI